MAITQVTENFLATQNSSIFGLSEEQVASQLLQYGKNKIVTKKKTPLIIKLLEEFKDLMVLILIFAAVVSLLAGEITDGSVILFIVFLNATIGFFQKFKAEKALEALQKLVAPKARVRRHNTETLISAEEIVPGDIIILNEGDSIPADAIILEQSDFKTQEAILTGESTPVIKEALTSDLESEREKISIFMSTAVAEGTAQALVTATGMQTQFGKIAELTAQTKKDKSPLEKELHGIGIFVGKITLVISAILFVVGFFLEKKEFIETFLFSASVAVAAVPEGLPATITIALALGVQRLAQKNAIIKQLSSVETLGSTTVICSDKTGTLTKNEMTSTDLSIGNFTCKVSGIGYNPQGRIHITAKKELIDFNSQELSTLEKAKPLLYDLLEKAALISTLCNNAKLIEKADGLWTCLGDPTEAALLTLSQKIGFSREALANQYPRIAELPFNSARKMMSTIHHTPDSKLIAFSKGAPDELLKKCNYQINSRGQINILTAKERQEILAKNNQMASQALRVIGLAYKELTDNNEAHRASCEVKNLAPPVLNRASLSNKVRQKYQHEDVEHDLIFVGLVGIIDPPREEVLQAVELTKKAGIKVYIITGDHGLTASAIARQLGITTSDQARIVTGSELNNLNETELLSIFQSHAEVIFARVSPEHKLKIVSALKNRGEIVAVTGDGVNDAPALKRADIGISMGITGTDVSKEASNMVLADDSFSTIVTAIKEGRIIYENMKKFIFYIFSSNIGELVTIFAAIFLLLPAPLTAILILAINLGTDVFPALALGIEPAEPKIMDQKPRSPFSRIMNRHFIFRFVIVGLFIGFMVVVTFIYYLHQYGWQWGQVLGKDSLAYLKASTIAFALLVIIQMVNAFNARSDQFSLFRLKFFANRWLFTAVILSFITLIFMVEVPFMQKFLRTTHLSLSEWITVSAISLSALFFEEIRKVLSRRTGI